MHLRIHEIIQQAFTECTRHRQRTDMAILCRRSLLLPWKHVSGKAIMRRRLWDGGIMVAQGAGKAWGEGVAALGWCWTERTQRWPRGCSLVAV